MTDTRGVRRGEIWWADLGQGVGSEQAGVRPIVVLQNNVGNRHAPTVIGAPITSKVKRHLPTHVYVMGSICGLSNDSTVLLEQVRAIDKSRLRGKIGDIQMDDIDTAIAVSMGLCAPRAKECGAVRAS